MNYYFYSSDKFNFNINLYFYLSILFIKYVNKSILKELRTLDNKIHNKVNNFLNPLDPKDNKKNKNKSNLSLKDKGKKIKKNIPESFVFFIHTPSHLNDPTKFIEIVNNDFKLKNLVEELQEGKKLPLKHFNDFTLGDQLLSAEDFGVLISNYNKGLKMPSKRKFLNEKRAYIK
jgi:hypothetical protein